MEGVLLVNVLTSVFLLHAGADIPIQADFNIQKIAGEWHHIAVALDNAKSLDSHLVKQILEPSENGDLLVKNTFMKKSVCGTREVTFIHTDEPGKFLSNSSNTLRMVDVNYDSYYIFHVEMPYTAALHLYTRKQTGLAQEIKKFKEVAESLGFKDHQINFLNKGVSTVSMVEVDYGSYCIIHVTTEENNVLNLYSREPQVSDAVREKFINYVTSLQFLQENIHYETRNGECLE